MTNLPSFLSGPVLVAGAGVSGTGMAELLLSLGVEVTVTDGNVEAAAAIAQVASAHPGDVDVTAFASVVTSPGWRPDAPLLVRAQEAGVEVLGDVEACFRLDRAGVFGSPRTWMVVTGTNGKTTTTAMLADIMIASGAKAQAVGNIGVAIGDALRAPERIDVLVAELSSFQLHWSSQLVPDVGVLLNLAEDHIDWHGSMDEYAAAKAKVLQASIAIAGVDDPLVAELARDRGGVVGFTLRSPGTLEVGVHEGHLVDRAFADDLVLSVAEGIEPVGQAGVLDALAAAAAARSLGVPAAAIDQALHNYTVAGHRGQVVVFTRGIVAVDNSKATNPHAADSALGGFDSVIWVAGGQLKGAEVDSLIRAHAHRLKAAALLGVDREIIAESLRRHLPELPIMLTENTDPVDAMEEVCAWAVAQADAGDAIVLAPAAASLDMYSGMGQRGDLFAAGIRRYLT